MCNTYKTQPPALLKTHKELFSVLFAVDKYRRGRYIYYDLKCGVMGLIVPKMLLRSIEVFPGKCILFTLNILGLYALNEWSDEKAGLILPGGLLLPHAGKN